MIFSIPSAPSITGTPKYISFRPYSPCMYAAHGTISFLSFRIASAICVTAAEGA